MRASQFPHRKEERHLVLTVIARCARRGELAFLAAVTLRRSRRLLARTAHEGHQRRRVRCRAHSGIDARVSSGTGILRAQLGDACRAAPACRMDASAGGPSAERTVNVAIASQGASLGANSGRWDERRLACDEMREDPDQIPAAIRQDSQSLCRRLPWLSACSNGAEKLRTKCLGVTSNGQHSVRPFQRSVGSQDHETANRQTARHPRNGH